MSSAPSLKVGRMLCEHLEIDHIQKRAEFSQVVYSDEQGEVYADKAWIDYDAETLKPTLVTLMDHVRLSTPADQFALADFCPLLSCDSVYDFLKEKRAASSLWTPNAMSPYPPNDPCAAR